jgi:hypothetical protein
MGSMRTRIGWNRARGGRTRRRAWIALVLAGALLAPATQALAAPGNAKNAEVIPLTCNDGTTYTVVVNSGQSGNQEQATAWGPGFVISGGTGNLIPTQLTFTGVDVTTGQTLFSQTTTKGNGQTGPQGTPLTCTFSLGTETLPNGDTLQLSGAVVAVLIGG